MKKTKLKKATKRSAAKSIVSRVRKMDAPEPIRPCKGRLIDYIIDMYDAPDQVELRSVYNGSAGYRQDSVNMRSYFNAAKSKMLTGG